MEELEIKELLLEKIKFSKGFHIPQYLSDNMNIDVCLDQIAESYNAWIINHLMGQKSSQTYTVYVNVPKNWFEHLKEQALPDWAKEYIPIRHKIIKRSVKFEHYLLFPEVPNNIPVIAYTEPPKEYGVIKND